MAIIPAKDEIMAIISAKKGIIAIIPAKAGITDYRESNATFVPVLRSKSGHYSGAVDKITFFL